MLERYSASATPRNWRYTMLKFALLAASRIVTMSADEPYSKRETQSARASIVSDRTLAGDVGMSCEHAATMARSASAMVARRPSNNARPLLVLLVLFLPAIDS